MNGITTRLNQLIKPFRGEKGFDKPLLIVFFVVNSIVLVNACLHDPGIGYDAYEHLKYIQALSEMRLVTPDDSYEFFSPPLPYLLPALFDGLTGLKWYWVMKFAQFLNFLLSLCLTFYVIKVCRIISNRPQLKFCSILLLGLLPVYYKTFAMVRGEPYVAFFSLVILYYCLMVSAEKSYNLKNASILGLAMGLCALSRQWGVLLFPAVFLYFIFEWVHLPTHRRDIARTLCVCLLVIFLISGWFYAWLNIRYGSVTAFNRKPKPSFSLSNQPLEFYFGLSPEMLFTDPVRPHFPNRFLPIFYSEMWGDYWGFFVVYGLDKNWPRYLDGWTLSEILATGQRPAWLETNYDTIGRYLGRVNLVSLFPSALAFMAIFVYFMGITRRRTKEDHRKWEREVSKFLLLGMASTMMGYFWFLVMYPSIGKGDTIKTSYVLMILPYVAILTGMLIVKIKKRWNGIYYFTLAALLICFIYNIRAMITNYSLHRLFLN
ncbi:MAG: glycosyltransferase family 39 protein [Deltaproteobacteria bacterium]|nr:glycosyltransferase family 39 protein [Deltaproteobacteria bacterium]